MLGDGVLLDTINIFHASFLASRLQITGTELRLIVFLKSLIDKSKAWKQT